MPPPKKPHGFVCANVSGVLRDYARATRSGYVCTNDTELLVQRDPDSVRRVDVMYYMDDQNLDTMDRRYTSDAPRPAAEVKSPTDTERMMLRRSREFLVLGVPVVWIIDPEARFVTVYEPGKFHQVLDEADEINGGDVLPGFTCKVAEFFERPGAAG